MADWGGKCDFAALPKSKNVETVQVYQTPWQHPPATSMINNLKHKKHRHIVHTSQNFQKYNQIRNYEFSTRNIEMTNHK